MPARKMLKAADLDDGILVIAESLIMTNTDN